MVRPVTTLAACVLAFGLTASAPTAMAQQSAGKTAVVNTQILMRDSDAAKSIGPQIQKLQTDYQGTVNTEQAELRQIQAKLNDERATLAPDVLQQRTQELAQKFQSYQRSAQQHQAEWENGARNAAQKISAVIVQIVEAIEKEQKLSMVFERSALIGTTTATDITPEVMKRLNQQLPSVTVELPK
jgi:outer membrane protein